MNDFLARLRFWYLEHQASIPHLQKTTVALEDSATDKMEYYTRSCYGDFRPYMYRRTHFQQFHQPAVFMVQAPVPTRSFRRDYDRTSDKNVRKHFGKSKSNATKARDKLRKQKFIENKTVCCGFPFFGLDNANFQKEIVIQMESRETKCDSKLQTAAETIKELHMQNKLLRSTIEALQRTQAREANTYEIVSSEFRNDELSKLQEDLEFEKQRVVKFVSQNVERQREINNLRSKLEEMIRHSKFAINQSNYLTEKINRLQEEKQHQEGLIDIFKRFEKKTIDADNT